MTRVTSSNYTTPGTQFQWATAGTDRFFRTLDLYYLSLAVEGHDHSAGKGLAVTRVANSSIDTDNIADGAVSSTKIEDLAVTAAKIADATITKAKMATDSVGTAQIEVDAVTASEIAAGAVGSSELADNAVDTAAIQDDAVTAAKIAAGAVGTSELADDAVTAAKIATGAVGSAELADDAVTAAKIATGAVGSAELADNAVDTASIQDDAVTAAKIVAGAVGSAELADNAVDTASIQDDAVTAAKIAAGAVGTSELADASVTAAKLGAGVGGARVGDMKMFTGNAASLTAEAAAGWHVCDGSLISATTYSALYNVFGGASSIHGGVSGGNFALPDLRDFFPIGVSGTKAAGSTGGSATLPNHLHTVSIESGDSTNGTGTSSRHDIDDTGNQFYVYDEGHHHYTNGNTGNPTTNPSILNPYKAFYMMVYSGVAH